MAIIRHTRIEYSGPHPVAMGLPWVEGVIFMENGEICRHAVTVGGTMAEARTDEQIMAIARHRISEYAKRVTFDTDAGKWLFEGKEVEA